MNQRQAPADERRLNPVIGWAAAALVGAALWAGIIYAAVRFGMFD